MNSNIIIEGMTFNAFHGFYPEEQKIGCKYSVDLIISANMEQAAKNDELEYTVNYETVYQIVRREMKINSKLIENVAYRIVKALKQEIPIINTVTITLYKYNPPLGGQLNRVAVQITD